MNKTLNRRVFMMQVVAGSTTLASGAVLAQATKPAAAPAASALLAENDAQAVALGYKADATKVDTKKFPKYAASQVCSNCQLYSGKDKEAAGPCGIFPGKQVAAKGWCSAWVKKAG
jgi:High potential iron-sulfur protein